MADWCAAGQPIADFWDATPREVAVAVQGLALRAKIDRTNAIIGGWVTAHQYARIRGDGELDSVADVLALFEPQAPARPQTAPEMIGAWRALVAATGGTLADPELAAAAGVDVTPQDPHPLPPETAE